MPDDTNTPTGKQGHEFTQDDLYAALNRKRQKPDVTSSMRFRKNKGKWISTLLAEHEKAKAAENKDLADALEACLSLLGHKFRAKINLSAGLSRESNSGMGAEPGRPADNAAMKDGPEKKDKPEFTGTVGQLIASRPDLFDKLAPVARMTTPAVARCAAMKKIILENPPVLNPAPITPPVPEDGKPKEPAADDGSGDKIATDQPQ